MLVHWLMWITLPLRLCQDIWDETYHFHHSFSSHQVRFHHVSVFSGRQKEKLTKNKKPWPGFSPRLQTPPNRNNLISDQDGGTWNVIRLLPSLISLTRQSKGTLLFRRELASNRRWQPLIYDHLLQTVSEGNGCDSRLQLKRITLHVACSKADKRTTFLPNDKNTVRSMQMQHLSN